MITYKGSGLKRYKEKTGGKNKSDIDGFYENAEHERFFIKKPHDQSELFAELFAGLLLKEFMNYKLVDKIHHPSLICADVIRFEDGSYGLIQPVVSFDPLHKIIGTSYADGKDRDPTKEALMGPSYYPLLTKQGQSFGLSTALMFSLLLGAHSVHSGNIVVLKNNEQTTSKQFGRIDWGDAFRNFAHKENNNEILYAYENRGTFNLKKLTKDYFLNYKKIKGLFPAIANQAKKLQGNNLDEELMHHMVLAALKNIPSDLIQQTTKDKLAEYMAMSSFKEVTFGAKVNFEPFATDLARLLCLRLGKICELKDLQEQLPNENLYASILAYKPIVLRVESPDFVTVLKKWNSTVESLIPIDLSELNFSSLVHSFNQFVEEVATQSESSNLWAYSRANHYNIFTPHDFSSSKQEEGNAFVAQYKESMVLRQLFLMDIQKFKVEGLKAFEQAIQTYVKANPNSDWVKLCALLDVGQKIIFILDSINKAKSFGADDAVNSMMIEFKTSLEHFQIIYKEVVELFKNAPPPLVSDTNPSPFYPMDDWQLHNLSGDELATIGLEEFCYKPSLLIDRIIKSDTLWFRMEEAFQSKVFDLRPDNPALKIAKIRELRHLSEIALLKNEILSVKEEQRQDLSTMIKNSLVAQKRYEEALKHNKEICFARMERMAPILQQAKAIELKAHELKQRNEPEAAQMANWLAAQIRKDVKEYVDSKETHENKALSDFKKVAQAHVKQSTEVLNKHREVWKYILANVSIGILLIGVGYVAAMLINKHLTGNYTFFSKTQSGEQLELLEEELISFDV